MMKNVCFITMRPNKGATGGPGGVLYMLQQTLGDCVKGVRCRYMFQPIVKRSFKGRCDKINRRIFQLYFMLHPNTYYVTHDIYTARLLAKMHRKYSLVYHQQGPIVQEKLNFGEQLSVEQIEYLHEMERIAFESAVSVHFPSKGAEQMYFDNECASCERKNVHVGNPLYNTIPFEAQTAIAGLSRDENTITFFSLGTLTEAKGQDQVVDIIEAYLQKHKECVRYIIVGRGPLQEKVVSRCRKLESEYCNFEFIYYEQLSHPEVMYVHAISDVYIMLHRISIFDFATLEAMQNNCAIVLSPVGGNVDFNKADNVIFISNANQVNKLLDADTEGLKKKNKEVFERFFSQSAFKQEYTELIAEYYKRK